MSTDTSNDKPKTRGKGRKRVRRNLAKDFERLTFYLETIIRVKDTDEKSNDDIGNERNLDLEGQLRAYRDVLDYITPKAGWDSE